MRYLVSESVLVEELQGEAVLLDLKGEGYFSLNAVGLAVWKHIKSGLNREEIVCELLKHYEVSEEQLERDVNQLMDSLLGARLIAPQPG